MANGQSKRPKKYDKPIQLKDGVEWDDLMKLSLKKPVEDQPAKKAAPKKKK